MSNQQPNQQVDQGQRLNIPIPDPSVLTTEALDREVGHLRELLGGKIAELARDFELFKGSHGDHHAAAVDKAIDHRRELTDEQFRGVAAQLAAIQRQFDERDERTRLAFEAAEKAVAAALTERENAVRAALEAAEKAGAKSEAATSKQIEGLQAQFSTSIQAQEGQIVDIKERLAAAQGTRVEQVETRDRFGANWGMAIGALGLLAAVIAIVINAIH
jgi:hypothetical protein